MPNLDLTKPIQTRDQFAIGDLVRPLPGSDTVLRSGCCAYDVAIVVRSNPLALASLDADMLWTATTGDMELEKIGRALDEQLQAGLKRLHPLDLVNIEEPGDG